MSVDHYVYLSERIEMLKCLLNDILTEWTADVVRRRCDLRGLLSCCYSGPCDKEDKGKGI